MARRRLSSWRERRPFRGLVEASPDIMDRLGPDRIGEAFDPAAQLRHVDAVFERVEPAVEPEW